MNDHFLLGYYYKYNELYRQVIRNDDVDLSVSYSLNEFKYFDQNFIKFVNYAKTNASYSKEYIEKMISIPYNKDPEIIDLIFHVDTNPEDIFNSINEYITLTQII
jgi:hypothetical protein